MVHDASDDIFLTPSDLGHNMAEFDTSQRRHSGLGVASVALSAITALGMFTAWVWAAKAAYTGPDEEPNLGILVLFMWAMCLTCAMAFVSLCLGIAGLCRRGRRKGLALVGVVVSALLLLVFGGLLLLDYCQSL